jgi:hypothetical protein
MKDENFVTMGGRITHPPGIYSVGNTGWLLSFSIAIHSLHSKTPLYMEVKVPGASDRTKLDEFATRLPVGRKVTVHHAELQRKEWKDQETGIPKESYHLFCRLDQIFLHELAASRSGAPVSAS